MIASLLLMAVVLMTIYLVHIATRKLPKGKERDLGLLSYREVPTKASVAGKGGRPLA